MGEPRLQSLDDTLHAIERLGWSTSLTGSPERWSLTISKIGGKGSVSEQRKTMKQSRHRTLTEVYLQAQSLFQEVHAQADKERRELIEAFENRVPDPTHPRVSALAEQIRPIIRDAEGVPCLLEPVCPLTHAYTWDPKIESRLRSEDLVLLESSRVFISWSYYGFFKPTIAECLAQMPSALEEEGDCRFFEIVKAPQDAADFRSDEETALAFDAGFHTCEVAYYQQVARECDNCGTALADPSQLGLCDDCLPF